MVLEKLNHHVVIGLTGAVSQHSERNRTQFRRIARHSGSCRILSNQFPAAGADCCGCNCGMRWYSKSVGGIYRLCCGRSGVWRCITHFQLLILNSDTVELKESQLWNINNEKWEKWAKMTDPGRNVLGCVDLLYRTVMNNCEFYHMHMLTML